MARSTPQASSSSSRLFTYQAVGLGVMAAIVIGHKVLNQPSGTSRPQPRPGTACRL